MVAEVNGTVLCGTNGDGNDGNSVLVDAPLVELDPQGDARFSGEVGFTPAALATAAIQDVCWYDLRHAWASWVVQIVAPLIISQEPDGWSSFWMVQRYAHPSSEHLRSPVDASNCVE